MYIHQTVAYHMALCLLPPYQSIGGLLLPGYGYPAQLSCANIGGVRWTLLDARRPLYIPHTVTGK